MTISLKNHLNAVAPVMGMIPMSFEINYDEGEEINFSESWAEAYLELRHLDVCMIGYVLTKYEEGFEESVGKTVVLYAEDTESESQIKSILETMDLDVVYTGSLGIKHAVGIDPFFIGLSNFTELLVSDLQDIAIVKKKPSIASAL